MHVKLSEIVFWRAVSLGMPTLPHKFSDLACRMAWQLHLGNFEDNRDRNSPGWGLCQWKVTGTMGLTLNVIRETDLTTA